MAEHCHNYGALSQKMAYVEQAERLSVLLSEHVSHKDDANTYLEKLYILKKRVVHLRSRDDPPKTPRRNLDRPVFTRPLNSRYQSSNQIPECQDECVQEKETREPKEYELESAKSSVYNVEGVLEPNVDRSVTRAVIHEEDREDSESVELRSSKTVTIRDKETTALNTTPRIVSLTDGQKESFLTETTYI